MPDDILKRLRFWSDDIGALIPSAQVATVKEAADEIERLRRCLRIAAGMLSTTEGLRGKHPEDALAYIEAAADALDGEPCPDCVDGIAPKDGNDGGTRYACPTCGGSGWWSDRQRCEGCGGTGRRG